MNKNIPAFWLVVLLGAASLLLGACKKDYVKIDDKLIRDYLDDNKITTAQRQESGLYFVPLTSNPTGVAAVAGKTVSVKYTGKLLNGNVFDSGPSFSFVLGRGRVIAGWDEGIALMRKGEKAQLLIPSALGYGSAGAPPSIPANSVLNFEVEIVDVK